MELLRLLQHRGRMTAGQLAAELEVSERTVFRDVEALSGAGVPVFAVRGPAGGFELLGGFEEQLPQPRPPGRAGGRRATVRISPAGRHLAALVGRPASVRVRRSTADAEGWVRATIVIGSDEEAVRDVLLLAGEVEVLSPPSLRRRVHDAAAAVVAAHETPT